MKTRKKAAPSPTTAIFAEFNSKPVRLSMSRQVWIIDHERTEIVELTFVGGDVAKGAQLVVRYRGDLEAAERLQKLLHHHGWRHVRIESLKEKQRLKPQPRNRPRPRPTGMANMPTSSAS